MKGKRVLITGATSGIGKAAAKGLGRMGAAVTFTTRDVERGKLVKGEIVEATGNREVEYLYCDLASFESIRKSCAEYKAGNDRLHVLINNAGVWDFNRRISSDGIERTFAVNYLAPFLMTGLLLDTVKKSAPARIVNVGSALHGGTINLGDIEFERKFSGFRAYRQSKLALLLHTRLLAEKLKGTGITVNCVQPGMVATNLARDAGPLMRGMFRYLGKRPERGAETPVWAASSREAANLTGEYIVNNKAKRSSRESYDMELAARLWKLGESYLEQERR
jgi:NAD(P)-dependent dehydrogenase (short-subunit alcohol dehydrogenase family)